MFIRALLRGSVSVALFLLSSQAMAAMSLDRMIVYFKPNQLPRQDIVVSNPDKENLYLQTEVYKVINPGTDKEEQVRLTDPKDIKLLATPGKAVIPPGGRRSVRLVSLEPPKSKEAVFRVTFRPVVGELEAKKTAIKLLVAYQALVFVRPQNPEYKVSASVHGDTMTFANKGNINVVLRNGKYCHNNRPESCTDLSEGARIYAGERWKMKLPTTTGKGFVQYGLFDGEYEETKKFPL